MYKMYNKMAILKCIVRFQSGSLLLKLIIMHIVDIVKFIFLINQFMYNGISHKKVIKSEYQTTLSDDHIKRRLR